MYYIDFDNTLYETGRLTKDVLLSLATLISDEKNLVTQDILEDLRSSFNSTTDNFFTFAQKISDKYKIPYTLLYNSITQVIITNGKKYVFPDALDFLKRLKKSGETICILTYVSNSQNLSQQALKLTGSEILNYVDEIYNTSRYKYELRLDYENSIFIDDDPRDLEGFYKAGARNIIRIVKPNNEKRTSKKLNLSEEIPTYTSFSSINIKE